MLVVGVTFDVLLEADFMTCRRRRMTGIFILGLPHA